MNKSPLIASLVVLSFCLCLGQTSPTSTSGTGIEGSLVISPARPGPIRQGDPDSGPLPNAKFLVVKEGETVPVASFTTNEEGHFKVSLPPGRYTVVKEGGKRGIGRFGPFGVEVAAGKMTNVQWRCDSGMR